jgi:hypothetical protein
MNAQFATEGAALWLERYSSPDNPWIPRSLHRGERWLLRAGVKTRNDDLAFLAYECWVGMSDLSGEDRLDDYGDVAIEVLDRYVTDHDAELLVQAVPEVAASIEGPVDGMTPEVSRVHTTLLRVLGAMRENWERA